MWRALILIATSSSCGRIAFDIQPDAHFGRFGGPGSQLGTHVAVDAASGDIVVSGHYQGTIDVGPGPLVSSGARDVFVARFTARGEARWSRGVGGSNDDHGGPVAIDAAGNTYLGGAFVGNARFGSLALTAAGSEDAFVVSHDADGEFRWAIGFGGDITTTPYASDSVSALVIDPVRQVLYVGGYFAGTVDFGGGPITTSSSGFDAYVAAFALDGAHLWSRTASASPSGRLTGLALDLDGNLYATGFYYGSSAGFGGQALPPSNEHDAFIVSFAPNGTARWSLGVGGPAVDWFKDIAVDNGIVYVGGYFQSTVDFGSGAVTPLGMSDGIVASYSTDGMFRWSRALGMSSCGSINGLAIDQDGVLLVGWFEATVDLGTRMTSVGSSDGFVIGLNTNGVERSALQLGANLFDDIRGVEVAADGSVYVVGMYDGQRICGDATAEYTALLEEDMFFLRL